MDQLELECPNCSQALELDAGFAGGVCRCSNCGTLMTVPDRVLFDDINPPDRPNHPVGTEVGTQEASDRVEDPLDAMASVVEAKTHTDPLPYLEPPPGPTPQVPLELPVEHYPRSTRGTSGMTPSNRRTVIRLSVVAAFILVMGSIIAACGMAISVFLSNSKAPNDTTPGASQVQLAKYNPQANPFKLTMPNILGVPIGNKTVVVIDASSASRPWLGLVKDALVAGTDFDQTDTKIQIVFGTETGTQIFPAQPVPLAQLSRAKLKRFIRGVLSYGQADLVAAIGHAVDSNPDQVVLVIGQPLTHDQISKLRNLLRITDEIRFDAIVLGVDIEMPALSELTASQGGHLVKLTTSQLDKWDRQVFR